MDWGLLNAAGQGLGAGFQSYKDTQKAQQEALQQKIKQERDDKMFNFEMKSKGYDPNTMEKTMADAAKVKSMQGLLGGYGAGGLLSDNATEEEYGNATKAFQSFKERELGKRFADTSTADALRTERLEKMRRDEEEKIGRLNVEGFERKGKVMPKEEEAVKLRAAQASFEALKPKIQRLRELIKEDGSNIMFGDNAKEASTLATDAQLLYKDVASLGALSGPDKGMLEAIIKDPSGFAGLTESESQADKRLETALSGLQSTFHAKAKSMGYSPLEIKPTEGLVGQNKPDVPPLDAIKAEKARRAQARAKPGLVNAARSF